MKLRDDFPILKKNTIYFDSACMTLKPIQVINAINYYYTNLSSCSGRSEHKLANELNNKIESSRENIKKFFSAKSPNEIIFTKNTTESINLIANSLKLEKNDIVLTTDKEHNSNLLPWIKLSKKGIKHQIVHHKNNIFDLKEFEDKMNKNVKLVSFYHTSNLDGYTLPIKEIVKIVHDYNALFLLDAAQSAGHHEINLKNLDVDFLACSGHKMLGPTGTGILYGKSHLLEKLDPFILGGGTVNDSTFTSYTLENIPKRFEAGLQDYAGILGLNEAVNYLRKVGISNIEPHELKLNKLITENLKANIIGPLDYRLRSGIINFYFNNIDSHTIALMLNEHNIFVRSGAHCVHSWYNNNNIKNSVRLSTYFYNTLEEAKIFIDKLSSILKVIQ